MRGFELFSVVVAAQVRGGIRHPGVRIAHEVAEPQFLRVRMAGQHLEVQVQTIVDGGTIVAHLELARREHARQPLVVLRVETHQVAEATQLRQ